MKEDFTFIGFCDRRNKEHRFRKCNGKVVRVKAPFKNKRFIEDFNFKSSHIEYCLKCDSVHMLWNKGELEEIDKEIRNMKASSPGGKE